MAKKKTDKKTELVPPVAKLYSPRKAVLVDKIKVEQRKLHEIVELLWFHDDFDQEEQNTRVVRALELYESLEPANGAEGMLAAQMVGTHFAALDCLRRAALSNQTFEGRKVALNQAQKLMTLYTKQLATLDKHRGKGQQKVTVEHVNVEAGGQAIVGNVSASENAPKQVNQTLTGDKEVPLDITPSKNRSKSKPGK